MGTLYGSTEATTDVNTTNTPTSDSVAQHQSQQKALARLGAKIVDKVHGSIAISTLCWQVKGIKIC